MPEAGVQRVATTAGQWSSTAGKPYDTDWVLRDEAKQVHGKDLPDSTKGAELYRELYALNSTALCLSGGGIRSAAFALGLIEALATHPRQPSEPSAATDAPEKASFLSQFQYLSSVSGGGYIASWLSAWIAREGYAKVWPKLVGRRDRHPENEPSEIAWLRAYSNYLTPRVGLFSADTWTALALVVRNLVLNWLVLLPALCLVLLVVKGFAAGAFLLPGIGRYSVVAFVVIGAVLMIWALGFALRNRPSRNPCEVFDQAGAPVRAAATVDRGADAHSGKRAASYDVDPHRNEMALRRAGADENTFLVRCLVPAAIAALMLALYMWVRGKAILPWPLWETVGVGLLVGWVVYALAWLLTCPPRRWVPCEDEPGKKEVRPSLYWWRDFASWMAAGGVYGALIGLGVYIVVHLDLWFVIANVQASANVSSETGYFLIALIYGVPWFITAQLTAEMIFVGLTNWQRFADADREWFGRSTGWFTATAIIWFAVMFLVLVAGHALWELIKASDPAKYGSSLLAIVSGSVSVLGRQEPVKSSATRESGHQDGTDPADCLAGRGGRLLASAGARGVRRDRLCAVRPEPAAQFPLKSDAATSRGERLDVAGDRSLP